MFPSDKPSSAAYSSLHVITVAISLGAGGIYQTPTRCGPWSACTMSQKRAAPFEDQSDALCYGTRSEICNSTAVTFIVSVTSCYDGVSFQHNALNGFV